MKLLGLVAGGVLLALTSTMAFSAEKQAAPKAQGAGMEQMMMQMMKQQMSKSCSNQEMLSCMEVSQSDCTDMMNGVLSKCVEPKIGTLLAAQGMSPEEREALNKELESCANGVSEEHGIDPEKAKSCSPSAKK